HGRQTGFVVLLERAVVVGLEVTGLVLTLEIGQRATQERSLFLERGERIGIEAHVLLGDRHRAALTRRPSVASGGTRSRYLRPRARTRRRAAPRRDRPGRTRTA